MEYTTKIVDGKTVIDNIEEIIIIKEKLELL
jgi:hypothetical protein